MQPLILVDGEYSDVIAADDRGLQYGDGLFETIAMVNGSCLLWDAHMQRLQQGCQQLGIPCPDLSLLQQEAEKLCTDEVRSVLKIIITRGSGGRGYSPPDHAISRRIVSRHPWPDYPAEYYTQGVKVRLSETRLSSNPALAGLKHLNRLEQVQARWEGRDKQDYAEALMCAQDGRCIEGTMTNLFVISEGRALTPAIRDCGITGIMRGELIRALASRQINCQECDISLEQLLQADELILSNSLAGIWPVKQFDVADTTRQTYRIGAVYQALHTHLLQNNSAWMP